ncbi:MAG: hypothetical protein PUF17_08125 [Lactimicrobium massiliense]|nr:hypothetical protein [Lactimicrobium massiliense]MDD6560922.1 hypothetical protein [Lactimicrobium massiliense]
MEHNEINDECITKLRNFYTNNKRAWADDIELLNARTMCLGRGFRWNMDLFDTVMGDRLPSKIVVMIADGYDNVSCKRGFNPRRRYFFFDSCGNLVSTDTRDYKSFLNDGNLWDLAVLAVWSRRFHKELSEGAKKIIDNYI